MKSHLKAPLWAIALIHCSRLFSPHCFKLSTYICTDFPRTFFPFWVIQGGLQQHWQREMETLGGITSSWPLSRKKWKGKLQVVWTGQKAIFLQRERRCGDGDTRKDKGELSQREQQKKILLDGERAHALLKTVSPIRAEKCSSAGESDKIILFELEEPVQLDRSSVLVYASEGLFRTAHCTITGQWKTRKWSITSPCICGHDLSQARCFMTHQTPAAGRVTAAVCPEALRASLSVISVYHFCLYPCGCGRHWTALPHHLLHLRWLELLWINGVYIYIV